ncbi:9312_t:CDS:2 [Acaulospora morrowiae]|uniref:9312_t:CDS:1 n=1 Tax=Acaulospora morrowiae TaxID=94023 RepID=A0A9N9E968_9GLOM|nr:9312_t:CDS:2 [Acaulospora morrowiae]
MKRSTSTINYYSLGFLALCIFLVRPVISDCLNSYDPNVDYFPDKVGNRSGFVVSYYNSYKIVTNTRVGETYVLYCTANPPNLTYAHYIKGYFQIPVKNVASLDQTTLTFLEIIGAQSSLRYVGKKESITSPCLQEDTTIQSFDNSSVANVDIVFSSNIASTYENKSVIVSMGDDLSPLSNAEWVKFVSIFFNLEKSANDFYSSVEAAYSCNMNNAASIINKKTIAWVAYDFDSGMYTVDNDKYYSFLVKDAGANPLNIITGSLNVSDLHEVINDVDIIIDQTKFTPGNDSFDNWQRLFGYYTTSTGSLPNFITHRRVFRSKKLLNANGFDDWSERAYARPDIFILDLIAIQYPTYLSSYKTTWLNNFSGSDEPTVITSANCTDATQSSVVLTCQSRAFTGDQTNSDTGSNGNTVGDSKLKTRSILIIVFSVLAGLMGIAAGVWLLLLAKRKYEERFFELKDEPEVQMIKADAENSKANGSKVENKV